MYKYNCCRWSVNTLTHLNLITNCPSVLLQHGADPNIRNTDGKTALDLADPTAKPVLTGKISQLILVLELGFSQT